MALYGFGLRVGIRTLLPLTRRHPAGGGVQVLRHDPLCPARGTQGAPILPKLLRSTCPEQVAMSSTTGSPGGCSEVSSCPAGRVRGAPGST